MKDVDANLMKAVRGMVEIAQLATELIEAEHAASLEREDLNEAYKDFKRRNIIGHVPRGSQEWDEMMIATKGEYASLQRAKGKIYRLKKRLRSAIERNKAA